MSDKFAISAIAAGLAVIVAAFSVAFYSLTTNDPRGRGHAQPTLDGNNQVDAPSIPVRASNG